MWIESRVTSWPIMFRRQFAQPIDIDSVFETLTEMDTYLTNALRHIGQIATCKETEGIIYIMNNNRDAWVTVTGGGSTLVFSTLIELNTYLSNEDRIAGGIATCLETEGVIYIMNNLIDAWVSVDFNTKLDSSLFYTHTGDTSIHFTKNEINITDLGNSGHTHDIIDINNLQNDLNSKLNLTGGTLTGTLNAEIIIASDYSGITTQMILNDSTLSGETLQDVFENSLSSEAFTILDDDLLVGGRIEDINGINTQVNKYWTWELLKTDIVNNLQTNLDNKTDLSLFNSHTGETNPHLTKFSDLTDTGHTSHIISDVIGLENSLNSKLNLTGGTLTGDLTGTTINATNYNGITSTMVTNLSSLDGDTITDILNTSEAIQKSDILISDIIIGQRIGEGNVFWDYQIIKNDTRDGLLSSGVFNTHTGETNPHLTKFSDLTDTGHTSHIITDIIDLENSLNLKTDLSSFNSHTGETNPHLTKFSDLTDTGHTTHIISDIINLENSLSLKTDLSLFNNHTGETNPHLTKFSDLTDTGHTTHIISDVINLENSLNSKLNLSGGEITGNLTAVTYYGDGSNLIFNDILDNINQNGVVTWNGNDIITINTDNTATFDISEMVIGVLDISTSPVTKYHYTVQEQIGIPVTNILTATRTNVYWDVINKIVVQASNPTLEIGSNTIIKIGNLTHVNFTNIGVAASIPTVYETEPIWSNYLTNLGVIKLNGYIVSDGNNDLSINHTEGKFISLSVGITRDKFNETKIPASAAPNIIRSYVDISGNISIDGQSTQIDTTKYDDGSGILKNVPVNNFVNIYIVSAPYRDTERVLLFRGSKTYNTINDARQTSDFVLDKNKLSKAFITAKISVKQGITNLKTALEDLNCHIVQTDQFGTPITDTSNNIIIASARQSGIVSYIGTNILIGTIGGITFDTPVIKIMCIDYTADINNPIKYLRNIPATIGNTLTYLTDYAGTWIGYDWVNSQIIQQYSKFTPLQLETIIQLGRILHHNHATINSFIDLPQTYNTSREQTTTLCSAGTIKLSGYILTANGANLFVNHSEGDFTRIGCGSGADINYTVIPSQNTLTVQHLTRDVNNKAVFGGLTTTIDLANYEISPNTLSDVASNRYSNVFFYTFPVRGTDTHYVLRDTKVYTSLQLAQSGGLVNGTVIPIDMQGGYIWAYISFRGEIITDLTATITAGNASITQVSGVLGGSNNVINQSLQSTYNSSITPEILTDSTRGALTIKNGTGNSDNITNLFEGVNSGNTVTSFIRADGAISGNTFYGDGSNLSGLVTTNYLTTLNSYTKEETGFVSPDLVNVSYNKVDRTVTLTGTITALYQGQIITALTGSTWTSAPHTSGLTANQYLYYDGSSFIWSPTIWTFDKLQICAVIYMGVVLGFRGIRECHGLMQWQTHLELHSQIGTYLVSGGATTGLVLNSTTVANRRPATDAIILADEDLRTTNPLISAGIYPWAWLSGTVASPVNNFSLGNTDIVSLSGNRPYYNNPSGGSYDQVLMPNNSYMSVYRLDIPVASDVDSQTIRSMWVQGQSISQGGSAGANATALAAQLALNPATLNLNGFGSTEYRIGYQYVIKYDGTNWTIQGHQAITGTKNTPVSLQGGGLTTVSHDSNFLGAGTTGDPLTLNTTVSIATISATTYIGITDVMVTNTSTNKTGANIKLITDGLQNYYKQDTAPTVASAPPLKANDRWFNTITLIEYIYTADNSGTLNWLNRDEGSAEIPVVVTGERVVTKTTTGVSVSKTLTEMQIAAGTIASVDWSTGQATYTGSQGQTTYDTNYKYECIGTNKWIRTALMEARMQLYLSPDIDDSGGAKTSAQLVTAYPTALIGQRVWGTHGWLYEKKEALLWKKMIQETA